MQYKDTPVDTVFSDWNYDTFGTNCFMFVRLVIYNLTDGKINFNSNRANGHREISGMSSYNDCTAP
ncbi:MAG: hypothetical protein IJG51_01300 [Synergistaceae bacterium]|nr:hypothetical protein [Synergistaceae bacterium]MBQ3347247.1 hypothetical protein [Synergistaceae bacterium]MBQ3397502.1 hypothetical protein [Synergistaceae bacterium]MBQ3764775.1 hypothetical protein [Synergistaceae bacterium]MBQ4401724.1 hypothetical protein [Synergistaceae bacterium]